MILKTNFYTDYSSSGAIDLAPTFVSEWMVNGTSLGGWNFTGIVQTNSNVFTGAMHLSTDKTSVAFIGYHPGNAGQGIFALERSVVTFEYTGALDWSTNLGIGDRLFRAFKHNLSVYVCGYNLLVHIPFRGGPSAMTSLATVSTIQDVSVQSGSLYATNYAGNSFGLAAVGTGTPTTANQPITTVIPSSSLPYPLQVLFYEKNGVTIVYAGNASPSEFWRLEYQGGQWVKKYQVLSTLVSSSTPTSQIAYETGDGTTTLLISLGDSIIKTVDDGTKFSNPTVLLSGTNIMIKGIEWSPQPPAVPVASPGEPFSTPLAQPMTQSPFISTPSSNNVNAAGIVRAAVSVILLAVVAHLCVKE